MALLDSILPMLFAFGAAAYLGLAIYVSRSSPQSIIGYFLFLIGILIAGTVFTHGTEDLQLYGIGRTLTFLIAITSLVAVHAECR